MGLARRAAGADTAADVHVHTLPIHDQTTDRLITNRLITNTTVGRRGVSERPHVPQHQGPRRRVRVEPGRLPIRGWVAKGAPGNEPLSSRESP